MEAKELRIGNYLKSYTEIVKIIGIEDEHLSHWRDGIDLVYGSIKKYEPIPITEEWLIKLGWTKESKRYEDNLGDFYFQKDGEVIFCYTDSPEYNYILAYNSDESWGSWKEVKYIHHLQNLFYCLTGQELELK